MRIRHISGRVFDVTVKNKALSAADRTFIKNFSGAVFCNGLTGRLWCFDEKLPSGRWLENIRPDNDLKTVHALVV